MRLSSFLYPLRCPICDEPTDPLHPQICAACRMKIPYSLEPRCVKCGKSVLSDREVYCEDCMRLTHAFDQGRAAWLYAGAVTSSLQRYKFSNRRQYAPFYAQEMMRCMEPWLKSRRAQALIPVPVSRGKRRARGYNQAALLAMGLSGYLGIPAREDILLRREGFVQQKDLPAHLRRLNLQKAFYVPEKRGPGDIPGCVILVDDIYTTGSTIDAASAVLRAAGVRTIYAACLCVGES